jgi:hypothetical protein
MRNDLWLAFALSIAVACSPATIAPPAGESGQDATKECGDRAYAYCGRLENCSTTAFQIRFGDETTCRNTISALCRYANAAPSSGASPAHTEACAKNIAGWACDDILSGQNTPPECAQAGSLPNGATCAVDDQCQTAFCRRPFGGACGVCAPMPKVGDPCADAPCPPTLACVSRTMTCAAYANSGNQCSATQPCNAGLTCVGVTASAPGVCEAGVKMSGEACSFTGAGCDLFSGLTCNAQKGTCAALKLVAPGGACGVVANQSANCIQGDCPHGMCVSKAGIGAPCDRVDGPSCVAGADCIVSSDGGTSGICQLRGATACP